MCDSALISALVGTRKRGVFEPLLPILGLIYHRFACKPPAKFLHTDLHEVRIRDVAEYVGLLWRDAWKEAAGFALATRRAAIRAVLILAITVGLMLLFQRQLAALGLIPAGSNEAFKKLVAAGFGLAAALGLFVLYLLVELVFLAPFRLWRGLKPTAAPSPSLVDEETKRLAGMVNALRERVMIHGFKTPVVADDPFHTWRATLETSTHPAFIPRGPLQARRDFIHATGCLAHVNAHHEPREEVDHWRSEVDRSADELIRYLLPS